MWREAACWYIQAFDRLDKARPRWVEQSASFSQFRNILRGNSLVVQWVGLRILTARGPGSVLGWGTKILQTMQHGQKKKENTGFLVHI